MTRERVSTQGIIRSLEPEPELPTIQLLPELVGTPSEHAGPRYVAGDTRSTKTFARAIQHIEKHCQRNIDRPFRGATALPRLRRRQTHSRGHSRLTQTSGRRQAVSLRDAIPQRRSSLARVTDETVLKSGQALSAGNLWSAVVGFLTVSPDEHTKAHRDRARAHVVGAGGEDFASGIGNGGRGVRVVALRV
jgi:hypothetical protein